MPNSIFLRGEDGSLVELKEAPYATEQIFQGLIEQYPDILAGGQITPEDPRRWVLLSREMGVPSAAGGSGHWFLDHLFLDQSGVPTLVEVKRSTDTRIRREVVGQMLDYAANAWKYWDVSSLRRRYEAEHTLAEDFGLDDGQAEAYWGIVGDNLRLGKLRLLFVADTIPESLLRIIEFLNDQMVRTEILGLEIKQYVSGDRRQIFVPKVVGRTTRAGDTKRPEKGDWDRDSFLEEVGQVGGERLKALAERVMADFSALGCRVWFGQGATHSSIVLIYDGKRAKTQLISVYPWKRSVFTELCFRHFKAPFHTVESRRPLKERFERALGVEIREDQLQGRPSFPFARLLDEAAYQAFLDCVRFILDGLRARDQALP